MKEKKKDRKKDKKISLKLGGALLGIAALLNLCGCINGFGDWYRKNVYRHIANGLGRLTDALPFCLGEILMYAVFLLTFAAIIVGVTALVSKLRKKKLRGFQKGFLRGFAVLFSLTLLVYSLNWTLPLRASQIGFDVAEDRVYTVEELQTLRAFMVEHLNEAAENVERDSSGNVVYCTGEELDLAVEEAMQALEDQYPLLAGFYPGNKIAACSAVLDWMDIGGFTYPYSMELLTNRYVTGLYRPMLLAHEECHHKGYYLESEANYLAYLALSQSQDVRLQYAAYENMYYYVNSALVTSLRQAMTDEELTAYYATLPQRSQLVKADELWAEELTEADYNSSVSQSAQTFAPAAESIADQGWKLQAQALGDACYDGVVEMLLKYYDGELYGKGNS